jgi:Protein of unknown function (DUF3179)
MHARLRLAGALIVGLLPLGAAWADQAGKPEIPPEQVAELVRQTLIPGPLMRQQFLMILRGRDNADVVPGLIQVLQFVDDDGWLDRTLAGLTGEVPGKSWRDWMVWQQAHPEIAPFEGFDVFKADVLAVIDPDFRLFLKPGVAHEIRLEEIVWGGVKKDGIPALTNPKQIAAADATWLQDDELVFGIEIAGDARAYPLRILDWHEMVNDVIGGLPVTLAYCTLCGSGILYDARVPGYDEPFVFGSSGLVYRSNLVEPVHGPAGGRAADRLGDRARRPARHDRELAGLAGPASGYQGALARDRLRTRVHPRAAVRRILREHGADVPAADARRAPPAQGLRVRAARRRARAGLAARQLCRRPRDQCDSRRSAGCAGRQRRDAHGAGVSVRRAGIRRRIEPDDSRCRRPDLADPGGCPGWSRRRAPAAPARSHCLLVRLAGLHQQRPPRRSWRG